MNTGTQRVKLFPCPSGEAVRSVDGSLPLGLQREDDGRQLLQLRGPEHPVLPEDAAHESWSSDHRAHHHRHQPWVSGVSTIPEEVQEQAGKWEYTLTLTAESWRQAGRQVKRLNTSRLILIHRNKQQYVYMYLFTNACKWSKVIVESCWHFCCWFLNRVQS